MSREPSAAEKMIGDFAPKLVELADHVLFGDVWNALGAFKPILHLEGYSLPWDSSRATSDRAFNIVRRDFYVFLELLTA